MLKSKYSILVAAIGILLSAPGFAQDQIKDNQPIVGALHKKEAKIQAKLQADYRAGLIDSTELAKLQRDFDGICVEEDRLKTKGEGMTDAGRTLIMAKLDEFEVALDKRATKTLDSHK
jgi:hypothetical protein